MYADPGLGSWDLVVVVGGRYVPPHRESARRGRHEHIYQECEYCAFLGETSVGHIEVLNVKWKRE